jgi:hypothetical protein
MQLCFPAALLPAASCASSWTWVDGTSPANLNLLPGNGMWNVSMELGSDDEMWSLDGVVLEAAPLSCVLTYGWC